MTEQRNVAGGPHQGRPVQEAGRPLEEAVAAMVLLHGRGGAAWEMLSLAEEVAQPGFAYLAPQAEGNSWYPFSFLAPIERNEPYLTSALGAVAAVLERLAEAGIPAEQTVLLGFSQGACLALEYAARYARHYGGVIGLSGGLIGPNGTARTYGGSLAGTAVFLGCSDPDPHIPRERVLESAQVLTRLGANVTTRLYPNMGHTINGDELDSVREIMARLAS